MNKPHYLLIAAALIATPAIAQTTAPSTAPSNAPAATTAPSNAPAATTTPATQSGQWRASKLIGVDVYNKQNEQIGEIDELIINKSGQVTGAVIGVGGFLGMGERNVMVTLDKLQFTDENGSTTGSASGDDKWSPDRAVMDGNKDQLKSMPEFKY